MFSNSARYERIAERWVSLDHGPFEQPATPALAIVEQETIAAAAGEGLASYAERSPDLA
jgi:hypothetical protein